MQNELQDNLEKGLVIFCGAGVSMIAPTCLPSWWQLNEQVIFVLTREIIPYCGEALADNFASQIKARRDNKRFPPEFQAEIISDHFGDSYFKVLQCLDSSEPNILHLAIAELAKSGYVRAVITSNFDRLFEIAFKKIKAPLKVYYENRHFQNLSKNFDESIEFTECLLLKLHGSVDDHNSLVDTLAQRMRGLSPEICSCLQYLLRKHHWLFLGYSGGDLEANPHYLCLESELQHAKGFTWLVRESAKNEPFDAVKRICKLYDTRAHIVRSELPGWFLGHFRSLLPTNFVPISALSEEGSELRKRNATQNLVQHIIEWSKTLGPVINADLKSGM